MRPISDAESFTPRAQITGSFLSEQRARFGVASATSAARDIVEGSLRWIREAHGEAGLHAFLDGIAHASNAAAPVAAQRLKGAN